MNNKPSWSDLPLDLQQLLRDCSNNDMGALLCDYNTIGHNWSLPEHIPFSSLVTPCLPKDPMPWKELKKVYK